jgi:hypothetical protein
MSISQALQTTCESTWKFHIESRIKKIKLKCEGIPPELVHEFASLEGGGVKLTFYPTISSWVTFPCLWCHSRFDGVIFFLHILVFDPFCSLPRTKDIGGSQDNGNARVGIGQRASILIVGIVYKSVQCDSDEDLLKLERIRTPVHQTQRAARSGR